MPREDREENIFDESGFGNETGEGEPETAQNDYSFSEIFNPGMKIDDVLKGQSGLKSDDVDDFDLDIQDEGLCRDEKNGENTDGEKEIWVNLLEGDNSKKVLLDDLRKSYICEKDYADKIENVDLDKQELERTKETFWKNASDIQGVYQTLTKFLEGLIPPSPDLVLAKNDPGEYQYKLALRQRAIDELQQLFNVADEAETIIQTADKEGMESYRIAQEKKLFERFPALKAPEKKKIFEAENKKTALEFGFGEEEINQTFDHRILELVHYARVGKIAEQNRKNAARRLSETPRNGRRSTPAKGQPERNGKAMRRLHETGTIEAAMAIDFD
ncbi:MAG: hypothetical protein PSN37_04795 [Alphaproteobacteria bacterium]|nr:hypothetical protein [Alphaproteobacteria bacterium]